MVQGSRRLVVRSLIFTSKQVEEDVTTVVISGKDRRGHLLSVSRVLDAKLYTIVKGYVSSSRGQVNDSFTISKDGRCLTSEELVELRTAIEAIESLDEPEQTTPTSRNVPAVGSTAEPGHDYDSGSYVLVDNQRSKEFTSVTISGPNGSGVFSRLLQVISEFGCNIIFGLLSTFEDEFDRRHDILHIVASDGQPVDEPTRILLSNTLTKAIEGE